MDTNYVVLSKQLMETGGAETPKGPLVMLE